MATLHNPVEKKRAGALFCTPRSSEGQHSFARRRALASSFAYTVLRAQQRILPSLDALPLALETNRSTPENRNPCNTESIYTSIPVPAIPPQRLNTALKRFFTQLHRRARLPQPHVARKTAKGSRAGSSRHFRTQVLSLECQQGEQPVEAVF